MRVLLVFPGLDFEVAYPLGLASIAAPLRAAGHLVHGLDVALDGLVGLDAALQAVRPDVVGLAIWSPALVQADQAVARVVAAAGVGSRPRIMLGGPHASLFPEACLERFGADAVVVGEGEETVTELVAAWSEGRSVVGVAGVVSPGEDGRASWGPARPLADLDALPLADREVFDPARYPHCWAARAPHAAPVVTSRGCPLACAHCPTPALHHRRWRGRSPASVVDEIRALVPLGIGHVLFEDEHPTVDRRRFLALCEALTAAALPVTWSCPNGLRPEALDAALLTAMARAGCTRVALGVESTDDDVLRRIGRCSLGTSEQAIRAARQAGIDVTLYFMLGLPGEEAVEPLRQLRFAARSGASGAHFSLHRPLPGAELAGTGLPPAWLTPTRSALYLGFYGHPLRLRQALRASQASVDDLPAAAQRLAGWLRYGRRPGVAVEPS